MILTLDVSGPEAAKLGVDTRKIFDSAGGTIGRLPDNAWVLPDPHISGRHALVRYTKGVFYLEDVSRNGVFINSSENRLVPGQSYPIKSGDRIVIEPFEIHASIASGCARLAASSDADFQSTLDDPASTFEAGALDPIEVLQLDAEADHVSSIHADSLPDDPVMHEPYVDSIPVEPRPGRPCPSPRPNWIPEDYSLVPNEVTGIEAPFTPVIPDNGDVHYQPQERLQNRPAPRSGPTGSPPDASLTAVLDAAGVADVAATPELARRLGQILRVVVAGIMEVLQARQDTKEEFRIGMTRFKPMNNNPLKFSANVNDALHNLLVKRNAAFLEPVDAFEDAFADLRYHQMATMAGIGAAFAAMLTAFNPDRLQEQFDREGKRGSLIAWPGRLRYWSQYRDTFEEIARDEDASFRELFGGEFAKAYEEQLKRLKTEKRGRQRSPRECHGG